MKITIVFPKNGDVTARFEDEIFAYTRAYKDMETLAEDYTDILLDGLDGSQLRCWSFNKPKALTDNIFQNCNCWHEENTEDEDSTTFAVLTDTKAIYERIHE